MNLQRMSILVAVPANLADVNLLLILMLFELAPLNSSCSRFCTFSLRFRRFLVEIDRSAGLVEFILEAKTL